nr:MAG TPA: hypothetical protein [Caudoviricetes sp.]
MYKITLADGTTLENLVLNGNNYVAYTAVDDAVFEGNMASVTITNLEDESTEQIEDGVLLSNIVRDGKSWLVLGQKSAEQKRQETIDSTFTDLQMALAEVYEMMIGGMSNG